MDGITVKVNYSRFSGKPVDPLKDSGPRVENHWSSECLQNSICRIERKIGFLKTEIASRYRRKNVNCSRVTKVTKNKPINYSRCRTIEV